MRTATNRRNPKTLEGVLDELNPVIRGWGNYYRRAKVRRLYHRLNRWIVLRVWNHQHKHWRNAGCRDLPEREITARERLLLPVEDIVQDLNRFLGGWSGYFRYGNPAQFFDKISLHAVNRLSIFVANRHQRDRRFGWWRSPASHRTAWA